MDNGKKQIRVRHAGLWVLVIILAVAPSICAVACTHLARRLIYQPHKIDYVPSFPKHVPGLERFWLETGQGRVEGWIIKGLGASDQKPGPAVMIAHGNRELIDYYMDRVKVYRRMGFTVMMGEYRGYGRSAGNPSREGIRADYLRFYDKLASEPCVDPKRIVFHGRSLGGAVLADIMAYRRPAAVILESTFTSIKAMAHGAPDFLLSDNYDTLSVLTAYEGPVFIIHGTRDRIVPVQHARELHARISHSELYLDDFGHNDGPADWFGYWDRIRRFFKQAGLLKAD